MKLKDLKIRRSEKDIKRAIIQYLRAKNYLVIPFRNTGFRKADGSFIPALQLGVSDILGVTRQGTFFAIEVKSSGKKKNLTPYQVAFLKDVDAHKGLSVVADCLDDVIGAGL